MSEQFTRGDVVSLLLEVMDWTYVKAHRETPMSEAEKKVLDEVRAALAEPEPTVKEFLTVDHIRSIWLDSWKACGNAPTPVLAEHFARQIERAHGIGLAKPIWGASENEVEAMMPRPAPSLEFLDGFHDGFRAAERHHGITKEDK